MKQIQNNRKSIGVYEFYKSQVEKTAVNQKSQDFAKMFVISNKSHTRGYDLEIYSLTYGFLILVISISAARSNFREIFSLAISVQFNSNFLK